MIIRVIAANWKVMSYTPVALYCPWRLLCFAASLVYERCFNRSHLFFSSWPIPCVLSKYEWVGQPTAGGRNVKKCYTSEYWGYWECMVLQLNALYALKAQCLAPCGILFYGVAGRVCGRELESFHFGKLIVRDCVCIHKDCMSRPVQWTEAHASSSYLLTILKWLKLWDKNYRFEVLLNGITCIPNFIKNLPSISKVDGGTDRMVIP
jgi:hypothetical protein